MHTPNFLLNPQQKSQELKSALLLDILVGTFCAIFIVCFISQSFIIVGPSMEPTLINTDRVLTEKISYKFHNPRRFDIIIFREPVSEKILVKRVIGLPGDKIEFYSGKTYVNDVVLDEFFIKEVDKSFDGNKYLIPPGSIFVLGDNRPISRDSRYFDSIPIQNIIGRAILVYWKDFKLLTLH